MAAMAALGGWQIASRDAPHSVKVNALVVVDKDISKAGHQVPRNRRMSFPILVGQPLRGFANDFEVSDDGVRVFLSPRK